MTFDPARFEALRVREEALRRDADRRAGELAGLLKRLHEASEVQCDSDDPEDLFSAVEAALRDLEDREAQEEAAYQEELAAVEAEFGDKRGTSL